MSPDIEAALADPLVIAHEAVRHLRGERERLEKAKAAHARAADEAKQHAAKVAAWQVDFDRAVAAGEDPPSRPPAPDYDIGRAQGLITQLGRDLETAARAALAQAAADVVPVLAEAADRVLSRTATGKVLNLPGHLTELNGLRAVMTTVAGCRWPQVRPEPRQRASVTGPFGSAAEDPPWLGLFPPMTVDDLVTAATGQKGLHGQRWRRFITHVEKEAEAEQARRDVEVDLAARAKDRQGELVGDTQRLRSPDIVMVADPLAGRR